MVCFNCKAQIPDTSVICPNCGVNMSQAPAGSSQEQPQYSQPQVMAQAQMQAQSAHARTHHEIKKRRWQRWFFYLVIVVLFVGMTAYMVKIYMDNTSLIESINKSQGELKDAQNNLNSVTQNLSTRDGEIRTLKQSTEENQKALADKIAEIKTIQDQQATIMGDYEKQKELGNSAMSIYASLTKLATSITGKDLQKFQIADFNLVSGTDSDNDGLSNNLETALGTSPTLSDTDGDKFSDKQELLTGYDPLVAGKKLPLDPKYSSANKGKIFIDNGGNFWYITMDGKKNFWGKNPSATVATPTPISTTTTATTSTTSSTPSR